MTVNGTTWSLFLPSGLLQLLLLELLMQVLVLYIRHWQLSTRGEFFLELLCESAHKNPNGFGGAVRSGGGCGQSSVLWKHLNDTNPGVQSKCTGFQVIGSFSDTVAELGEMETCFFSETWYPCICPNRCMRCKPALASVVMGCVCWFLVYFPVSFLCYCLEVLVSQSFICISRLYLPLCPNMMSLAPSLSETLCVSFVLIR